MSYKSFTDIDLQENELLNVRTIRSNNLDNSGITISTKGKSGKCPTTANGAISYDGGLNIYSEHFINDSEVYEVKNTILYITDTTLTSLISPNITIESKDESPSHNVSITDSDVFSITSNKFKLKAGSEEILSFTTKDNSTLDINTVNSVTENVSEHIYLGTSESSSFHATTTNVDIKVPLNIKNGTVAAALCIGEEGSGKTVNSTIYGNITQSKGNVSINAYDQINNTTTINGSSVIIQPASVSIGDDSHSVEINGENNLSIKSDSSGRSVIKSNDVKVINSNGGGIRIYTTDNSLIFERTSNSSDSQST